MRYLLKLCAAGLFATLLPMGHAAPAKSAKVTTAAEPIEMFAGEARVLPISAARIAIGNGKTISASAVANNQLLILAEEPGSSTLHIWLKDGTQREMIVRVSGADLKRTLDDVNRLLSAVDNVKARIAGTKIVLEGEMVSDADQGRAAAIASMYPDQVVNFIGKVGWEKMIHLDVKVLELTTRGARDLGIRWDSEVAGPSAGLLADLASNSLYRFLPDPAKTGLELSQNGDWLPNRVWPPKGFITMASVINSRLNLLVQDGDAQMLAAPSLSTRSGSKARFVAGGEIPLPTINALGGTNVEFKEYGIIVEMTPVTDRSGAIYAKVEIEVSNIDRAVTVNGIPGLQKRESSAEFNARDGETVVLNGLYAYQDTRDTQKIPGLGNIPLLGGAFRNKESAKEMREVAIIITPRLVEATPQPLAPADVNGQKLYEFDKQLRDRELGPRPPAKLSITE